MTANEVGPHQYIVAFAQSVIQDGEIIYSRYSMHHDYLEPKKKAT
jgi:hypothetical protein